MRYVVFKWLYDETARAQRLCELITQSIRAIYIRLVIAPRNGPLDVDMSNAQIGIQKNGIFVLSNGSYSFGIGSRYMSIKRIKHISNPLSLLYLNYNTFIFNCQLNF